MWGVSMRLKDWFCIEAFFIPLWVLLGSGLGLIGVRNMSGATEQFWIGATIAVTIMAWATGARQVSRERSSKEQDNEIEKSLGQLVSVTQPSPVNIIQAAAAKILDLEGQLKQIQRGSPRSITAEQWDAMSSILCELPTHVPQIIVLFREEYFEAASYAREFARIFQYHGIGGSILTIASPPLSADLTGLVLRYESSQRKPDILIRLSRALTLAHIDHREEAVPLPPELKGFCELVVGRNQ
jgi:hypothetical protein